MDALTKLHQTVTRAYKVMADIFNKNSHNEK